MTPTELFDSLEWLLITCADEKQLSVHDETISCGISEDGVIVSRCDIDGKSWKDLPMLAEGKYVLYNNANLKLNIPVVAWNVFHEVVHAFEFEELSHYSIYLFLKLYDCKNNFNLKLQISVILCGFNPYDDYNKLEYKYRILYRPIHRISNTVLYEVPLRTISVEKDGISIDSQNLDRIDWFQLFSSFAEYVFCIDSNDVEHYFVSSENTYKNINESEKFVAYLFHCKITFRDKNMYINASHESADYDLLMAQLTQILVFTEEPLSVKIRCVIYYESCIPNDYFYVYVMSLLFPKLDMFYINEENHHVLQEKNNIIQWKNHGTFSILNDTVGGLKLEQRTPKILLYVSERNPNKSIMFDGESTIRMYELSVELSNSTIEEFERNYFWYLFVLSENYRQVRTIVNTLYKFNPPTSVEKRQFNPISSRMSDRNFSRIRTSQSGIKASNVQNKARPVAVHGLFKEAIFASARLNGVTPYQFSNEKNMWISADFGNISDGEFIVYSTERDREILTDNLGNPYAHKNSTHTKEISEFKNKIILPESLFGIDIEANVFYSEHDIIAKYANVTPTIVEDCTYASAEQFPGDDYDTIFAHFSQLFSRQTTFNSRLHLSVFEITYNANVFCVRATKFDDSTTFSMEIPRFRNTHIKRFDPEKPTLLLIRCKNKADGKTHGTGGVTYGFGYSPKYESNKLFPPSLSAKFYDVYSAEFVRISSMNPLTDNAILLERYGVFNPNVPPYSCLYTNNKNGHVDKIMFVDKNIHVYATYTVITPSLASASMRFMHPTDDAYFTVDVLAQFLKEKLDSEIGTLFVYEYAGVILHRETTEKRDRTSQFFAHNTLLDNVAWICSESPTTVDQTMKELFLEGDSDDILMPRKTNVPLRVRPRRKNLAKWLCTFYELPDTIVQIQLTRKSIEKLSNYVKSQFSRVSADTLEVYSHGVSYIKHFFDYYKFDNITNDEGISVVADNNNKTHGFPMLEYTSLNMILRGQLGNKAGSKINAIKNYNKMHYITPNNELYMIFAVENSATAQLLLTHIISTTKKIPLDEVNTPHIQPMTHQAIDSFKLDAPYMLLIQAGVTALIVKIPCTAFTDDIKC